MIPKLPRQHLTIEFSPKRCVGTKKCIEIAPTFFRLAGKKASLKGARLVNENHVLMIDCTPEQVEQFINSASSCPVNAIAVSNEKGIMVGTNVIAENVPEVVAQYNDSKEFVLDPKGYFLIRIDPITRNIEVGFCNERNKVVLKVLGKKPIDIYQTIINKVGLDIRKDHCAYLGRELQKAYIALQKNIPYVQDDELQL